MEVYKRNFPKIMRDNDELYFAHLQGTIEAVDELSTMEIIKLEDKYHFRLAPSIPKYTQTLLHEILKLNTIYGIHLELAKSIRISSTITFDIIINN